MFLGCSSKLLLSQPLPVSALLAPSTNMLVATPVASEPNFAKRESREVGTVRGAAIILKPN